MRDAPRLQKERGEQPPEIDRRLVMPWTAWVWKPVLIATIYVIVYISFGMFVFRPLADKTF